MHTVAMHWADSQEKKCRVELAWLRTDLQGRNIRRLTRAQAKMQQLMNVIRRSGYGYGDSLMTNEGYYVTETAWFRAVKNLQSDGQVAAEVVDAGLGQPDVLLQQ